MSQQYRKVRVTLVRSPIGYTDDQRATAVALGLRKMHATAVHTETPQIAGMLHKIRHLLRVEEVTEEQSK